MSPANHTGRRWLCIDMHKHGQNVFLGRVFSTDAACRWLYCCNIEGNHVVILNLWTPQLRKQHRMELTEEVRVELLALAIEHLKVHEDFLWQPAQEWPHNWRQDILRELESSSGISLSQIEKSDWWKAAEIVLFSLGHCE